MHLHHARGHHRQIRHHVVLAEERPHGLEHVREALRAAVQNNLLVLPSYFVPPLPRVSECLDLRDGLRGITLAEQDVVGGVGVEGRIEVDEIDGLIRDMLPHNRQIIPEVELVAPVRGGHG